jgi:restriction system protein
MSVPNFQAFFVPVLRAVADGNQHATTEIRQVIASSMKLTPEDLDEKLPSGNQTLFSNRVSWSLVYLAKANALRRPTRGFFQITKRGEDLLRLHPKGFTRAELQVFPEFTSFVKGQVDREDLSGQQTSFDQSLVNADRTPEENVRNWHKLLQNTLANEVLETVRRSTPRFFEKVVVDLLVAMGYGGSVQNPGTVTKFSGDDGLDGFIRQDKLGLDMIHIQAKRWSNPVGRPDVQAFAGSLEGARSRKGVFITTSKFTAEATQYVERIERRIILIDGAQLATLMVEHNVGVATSDTLAIKRLDSSYFESA